MGRPPLSAARKPGRKVGAGAPATNKELREASLQKLEGSAIACFLDTGVPSAAVVGQRIQVARGTPTASSSEARAVPLRRSVRVGPLRTSAACQTQADQGLAEPKSKWRNDSARFETGRELAGGGSSLLPETASPHQADQGDAG